MIGSSTFEGCNQLDPRFFENLYATCHFLIDSHESKFELTKYVGPGGDVVIPEGIDIIGAHAFDSCTSLTSIVIPEGVTQIGDEAFDGCDGLTLRVREGSCAHQYAIDHGVPFELL